MKHRNEGLFSNSLRLTLIWGCLSLAILGCSLSNRVFGRVPTDTPEIITTLSSHPVATPKSSATAKIQPTTETRSCYLGSWALMNISNLIMPILVQDNIQNVQYTGSTGSLTFSITPDGKVTFSANQYHSLFSGKLGFLPITVDVLIEGSGSGDYSLAHDGGLLISNPNFGGITISATAVSIEIMPATPLSSLMPALQGTSAGKTYTINSSCNGDHLTLDTGSSTLPPLEFTRIQP
jgi:hypothetical protein